MAQLLHFFPQKEKYFLRSNLGSGCISGYKWFKTPHQCLLPQRYLYLCYLVSYDTCNLTIPLTQHLSLCPGPEFSYSSVICMYHYLKNYKTPVITTLAGRKSKVLKQGIRINIIPCLTTQNSFHQETSLAFSHPAYISSRTVEVITNPKYIQ